MVNTKGATAGLRGAFWDESQIPSGTKHVPINVQTQDGSVCYGMLSHRGGEKCCVMIMHPREYLPTHYLIPSLLRANLAVLTQAPRTVGNDIRLEHERALLDVAAGIEFLRNSGYDSIVLLGNSGGAGLFSFYVQQSSLPPSKRLNRTPGGKPVPLQDASLPEVDGVILLSPHPGQGALLMNAIDPSVTDENDALSIDPTLFPFDPKNGFRKPPESSSYSPEFVKRYRDGQRQRVKRIDSWAREKIAERMDARGRVKEARDPTDMIIANHTPIITVWRTDADLRCWDLSLDPSGRRYGSLWGSNPFVSNFGSVGFGRTCTAESWLSTWSGLSSNASLVKCAPYITQPTLLIVYDGDNCVFPEDANDIFDLIASDDKERQSAPGDHHGRRDDHSSTDGRALVAQYISNWAEKRFV